MKVNSSQQIVAALSNFSVPPPTSHFHHDDTRLLNAVRNKTCKLIKVNITKLTDELISSEEAIIRKSSSRAEFSIDSGRTLLSITAAVGVVIRR